MLIVMLLNMVGALVENSCGISPETGSGNPKLNGIDAKFAAAFLVPWLDKMLSDAAVFFARVSEYQNEKQYQDECERLFKLRDAVCIHNYITCTGSQRLLFTAAVVSTAECVLLS